MSTSVSPTPVESNTADVAPASPKARGNNPQFIPLSHLSSQKMTMRDLLPVLPAILISLVCNAAFVIGMVVFSGSPENSSLVRKQTILMEEDTKIEQQKEKDQIDPDADDLSADTMEVATPDAPIPGDAMPEEPQGYEKSDDENAIAGAGTGDQGGIQGAGALGAEGFAGNLLDDAKYGFKEGIDGAGPIGDGAGIPTGRGGGSMQNGGFGARGGNNLEMARRGGGNDASEAAVGRALVWLRGHQSPDGRWSLNNYHKHNPACRCKDMNVESSTKDDDTAGTALGLLPFLGAGHHHKKSTSQFAGTVHKALQFMISRQASSGHLGGDMYSHALATIALCEAYAMSSDIKVRGPAQKAIAFIEYAQNPQTGGWRYQPRTDGDTSVVGWQVMALRSGQMAGLLVKSQTLELAKRWLDSCSSDGGSKYSYTPGGGPTPTMTAAGLLNRQYLGWGPRNPDLHKGCEYMLKTRPNAKPTPTTPLGPIYYYYYASQVMHHMGDKYWDEWNPLMRDLLITTQEKEGHKLGSWNPKGADFGAAGGRIYTTALATLTLEVYYRHLPLYRRESGAKEAAPEMKGDAKKDAEVKKEEKK